MSIFLFFGTIIVKLFVLLLKRIDYLFVGFGSFYIVEMIYGISFNEADIHIAHRVLTVILFCAVWYALTNFICIKGFYPFKWIGILFCGLLIGVSAYGFGASMFFSIVIGTVGTVIVAFARHSPIGIDDFFPMDSDDY
jgi:hypothetical protein